MQRLSFAFAVHNHQPAGNFESVIEEAHRNAYRPFLDVLHRHPGVKVTLHWTGTLLEWLIARQPETIALMTEMVTRGQVEFLTGSYYEAILPIIPPADAVGQIRKLTDTIERTFGVRPRGMWLAERVWEPHLVSVLADAGVEFTMLDDSHFMQLGLMEKDLGGYYVTEESGRTLKVFPMDKTLRYAVPFRAPGETIQRLQGAHAAAPGSMLLHADDGEKFGVWPKTHAAVYENGWLESFCSLIEEHSGWLESAHLGTIVDNRQSLGLIYLPTASYPEMMKWSLGADAFRTLDGLERRMKETADVGREVHFVRGGFWRNFLARYPEANQMHKKMLRVSRRAERLAATGTTSARALDYLWAGQCNDAYWHGVFGGLYLPNLRSSVYRNLLEAEAELDSLERVRKVHLEQTDVDADGLNEVVVESPVANFYFKPSLGGCLTEFDFKPERVNILDTLTRREEGYHERLRHSIDRFRDRQNIHDGALVKEEGLERYLGEDWYRRASLLDHFFGRGSTLDQVAACTYREMGDFVNQPYDVSTISGGKETEVILKREGGLWDAGARHRIAVHKVVACDALHARLVAEYTLTNLEDRPIEAEFGVEFNVGLQAGDAHDRYYVIDGTRPPDGRLRSRGATDGVREIRLVDEWQNIEVAISVDQPASVWRFPVETVSLSESGFERVYQGSAVIVRWRVSLPRYGKEFRVRIGHSVVRHKERGR